MVVRTVMRCAPLQVQQCVGDKKWVMMACSAKPDREVCWGT